jgi:hypothetical protein
MVRFPAGAGNFSLHHRVQNGSGAHPASYPMDTGAFSLAVKRPGREADHSPPSSAEVKNAWSCTSTPPIRLHGDLPLPLLSVSRKSYRCIQNTCYIVWDRDGGIMWYHGSPVHRMAYFSRRIYLSLTLSRKSHGCIQARVIFSETMMASSCGTTNPQCTEWHISFADFVCRSLFLGSHIAVLKHLLHSVNTMARVSLCSNYLSI